MSKTTRREALTLAAWAAAGRLPLLGASATPAGASPVQGWLAGAAPGEGSAPARTLRYAVLRWTETDPKTAVTKNAEIGRLELAMDRQGDQTRVRVVQTTKYSQPHNRIEAEILCRRDPLLSLQSWKLTSTIEQRADCRYEASGRVEGHEVRLSDGLSERSFPVDGPLVCPWTLPFSTSAHAELPERFALLDELLLYKPDQRLRREASVSLPYRDGERKMSCWSQRGTGVLPLHYFADDQGRCQLVTQSALAWALQEAE
ncbi:MAG: hypothetical protein GC160_05620 [Acidobacteria bacterium]|nr:hypothetical protein [Acidobacteriota bacterium]